VVFVSRGGVSLSQYRAFPGILGRTDVFPAITKDTDQGTNKSITTRQELFLNQEIQDRFYKSLNKEQNKRKPNPETLECYLSHDYDNRRTFVKSINPQDRSKKLLEKYPLFKDHNQVGLSFLILSFSFGQVLVSIFIVFLAFFKTHFFI